MQHFDQVLLVRVHVLFDGPLLGPWRVEVQRDPAVVLALSQDPEERRKVDAAGSEPLIKIDRVVLLFTGRRTFPSVGRAVLGFGNRNG